MGEIVLEKRVIGLSVLSLALIGCNSASAGYVDIAANRPLLVFTADLLTKMADEFHFTDEQFKYELNSVAENYCIHAGFSGTRHDRSPPHYSVETVSSQIMVLGMEGLVSLAPSSGVHLPMVFSKLECFRPDPVLPGAYKTSPFGMAALPLHAPTSQQVLDDPEANLTEYPTLKKIRWHSVLDEITLGDLHGNALKLLYFLMREGVATVSPEDYRQFHVLYDEESLSGRIDKANCTFLSVHSGLDPAKVGKIKAILSRVRVERASPKIRLIGDVLSDRGANDYFTFKLLEKLKTSGVQLEILISNHDLEFIRLFFCLPSFSAQFFSSELLTAFDRMPKRVRPSLSLNRLVLAAAENPEIWTEITDIFVNHYLPSLKVISLSEKHSTKELAFFSHAWVGIEAVENLAWSYSIQGCDQDQLRMSRDRLNYCVAEINQKFRDEFLQIHLPVFGIRRIELQIQAAFDYMSSRCPKSPREPEFANFPIYYTIWNRGPEFSREDCHLGIPSTPDRIEDYRVSYVFGHVGEDSQLGPCNLDTHLGKIPGSYLGKYRIFRF